MAERGAGLAGLALALLYAVPVRAERLPPRNECASDAPLAAFIGRLRAIVAGRDETAQFALAAPMGYVRRIDLRSPIDYRLIPTRRRVGWTIAVFVAGD